MKKPDSYVLEKLGRVFDLAYNGKNHEWNIIKYGVFGEAIFLNIGDDTQYFIDEENYKKWKRFQKIIQIATKWAEKENEKPEKYKIEKYKIYAIEYFRYHYARRREIIKLCLDIYNSEIRQAIRYA